MFGGVFLRDLELLRRKAREGFREQRVVGRDPRQELAARPCEALVQRVGLAAVRLADPPREPVLELPDDVDRFSRISGRRVIRAPSYPE